MKNLIIGALALLLLACTNEGKVAKETDDSAATKEQSTESITSPQKTFAAVWAWETDDKEYAKQNLVEQSDQLMALWKKGVIENAYFNSQEPFSASEDKPSISFFINAKDKMEAISVLDELIFAKLKIASYKLYPVGLSWLGRNQETLEATRGKKTFVAVWENTAKKEILDDNIQQQSEQTMALWNKGIIENAYLDVEGSISDDRKMPGVVYFINAYDEADARKILDQTVFAQKNLAKCMLKEVGVFWLGKYQSE